MNQFCGLTLLDHSVGPYGYMAVEPWGVGPCGHGAVWSWGRADVRIPCHCCHIMCYYFCILHLGSFCVSHAIIL